jgi:hypothetical protein
MSVRGDCSRAKQAKRIGNHGLSLETQAFCSTSRPAEEGRLGGRPFLTTQQHEAPSASRSAGFCFPADAGSQGFPQPCE